MEGGATSAVRRRGRGLSVPNAHGPVGGAPATCARCDRCGFLPWWGVGCGCGAARGRRATVPGGVGAARVATHRAGPQGCPDSRVHQGSLDRLAPRPGPSGGVDPMDPDIPIRRDHDHTTGPPHPGPSSSGARSSTTDGQRFRSHGARQRYVSARSYRSASASVICSPTGSSARTNAAGVSSGAGTSTVRSPS